jgi:predicted SAM-dependent methyltransferase
VSFEEAVMFLREAKRMLAPGGTLRLSTPDLRLYLSGYLDPKMTFFRQHHALMTTGDMEGKNKHSK